MKKILLVITLIAATLAGSAQTTNYASPMLATIPATALGRVTGLDSVRVNGATAVYLYVKPSLNYRHASFHVNVTRITAAMNGIVTLQASNDGINYFATGAADTVHIDNGATDLDKIVITPATGVLYQYYRLKGVNTATTDTFTMKAFWFGRQ